MKLQRQRFRLAPQLGRQLDNDPLSALTVKQRAGGQLDVKRLFQTDRLSAQLNSVAVVRLGLSVLVFDRIGNPQPASFREFDALTDRRRSVTIIGRLRTDFMELNHVGDSG